MSLSWSGSSSAGGTLAGAPAHATDTSLSGVSSLDEELNRYMAVHDQLGDQLVPVDELAEDLGDIMEEAMGWDVTGSTPRGGDDPGRRAATAEGVDSRNAAGAGTQVSPSAHEQPPVGTGDSKSTAHSWSVVDKPASVTVPPTPTTSIDTPPLLYHQAPRRKQPQDQREPWPELPHFGRQ